MRAVDSDIAVAARGAFDCEHVALRREGEPAQQVCRAEKPHRIDCHIDEGRARVRDEERGYLRRNMNITAADVKETAALDAKQYFSMALTRP